MKEAERIALDAAKKQQDEAAKKEAEILAQQKIEAARLEAEKAEAQRKEAERLQAEEHAAEERAKIAALEEADRKQHEAELEKQHIAEICSGDLAKLNELTAARQTAAIQNFAKESACPTIKPAIETALGEVARGIKRACETDRKTLAALKKNDIGSLKTAIDHMSCETVRDDAQQRVAKLEENMQREQSICTDEKTKLDSIDASAAAARQQYEELSAHAACPSLHAEINGNIKKIDARVKEAQTELARLGCYNAPINGKFDDATKKSLALYYTKKGSLADGDHLTDGLLSELKQQNLGICPPIPPAAPIVATPGKGEPPSETTPPKPQKEEAKREEEVRPDHKHRKIETSAHEEEPASRPSRRHKVEENARLEEEPVSRPPRHRIQRETRQEEPAPRSHPRPSYAYERSKSYTVERIRRAPSMPMSSTATAGSVHSSPVGVGY